jgi:alkyldihydroxyacetonephosphate synthase
VESVRAVTVRGDVWESRRLPASGAGPSPDRLLLGSEGTLAVITEAWVRILPRDEPRWSARVAPRDFEAGLELMRDIVQSGLRPSNCRLIEGAELALTMAGDGSRPQLLLGFEGDLEPVRRAREICQRHYSSVHEGGGRQWRTAFMAAPYLRDTLVAMGVLTETFETAVTWDRLPRFVEDVKAATAEALGEGLVTCRITHAYPDGAAPYFTVVAPARRGEEEEQWADIKSAAAGAVLAGGGTITHHHAVGRDHRPWYDRQRPEPFAAALRAAKAALDPDSRLNPGVLLD